MAKKNQLSFWKLMDNKIDFNFSLINKNIILGKKEEDTDELDKIFKLRIAIKNILDIKI